MSAPRRTGGRYVADPKTHDLTRTEAPTASDPRGDRPRDAGGTPIGRSRGIGGTGRETSGPAAKGARARPAAEDGAAGSSIPSEPAAPDPSAVSAPVEPAAERTSKPAAKARDR